MFAGRKLFPSFRCGSHVTSFAAVRRNLSNNALQSKSFSASIPHSRYGLLIGSVMIVGYFVNPSNSTAESQCDLNSACNINAAKKEIIKLIEAEDEKKGDGTSIGPTIVRLAWHASG